MKKVLFCVFVMSACMSLFAQKQPVVAVAPFDAISGISATDANMITRVFFIRLGNTQKVSLVDRNVVERVLQEHNFQAGDWSSQQKTAELGKALNTDWIVRGELEKFGNNILVTVQFYDIQTFRFMGGSDLLLANVEEAMQKIDPLVNKLVETIAATPVKHPLIGVWVSEGATIEFKDDGTFFCSGWERDNEDSSGHPVDNNYRLNATTYSLSGSGTYTYTAGTLSLKCILTGSKIDYGPTPRSWGRSIRSRNDNYSEQRTCTVSYSITTNGELKVGRDPFFEQYKRTGNNAGEKYYEYFKKNN